MSQASLSCREDGSTDKGFGSGRVASFDTEMVVVEGGIFSLAAVPSAAEKNF